MAGPIFALYLFNVASRDEYLALSPCNYMGAAVLMVSGNAYAQDAPITDCDKYERVLDAPRAKERNPP